MAFWRILVFVGLLAATATAAWADPGDAVGAAIKIVNRVTGEYSRNMRNLASGDDVHQEETLAIGQESVGEFMLRDQTKFALAPGARLTLDRFIYDPDRNDGSIVLDLHEGGFRIITGIAAKPVYVIRTPVAYVTVAGIFDVFVEAAGSTWILLHEGAGTVCNNDGKCRELKEPCRIVRISANANLPKPELWNALPYAREVNFDTAFPFVVKPPGIDSNATFSREDIELGRCREPKVRKAPSSDGKSDKSAACWRYLPSVGMTMAVTCDP